jgi:pimeloyl-ACP methyl ester carboxylesterase
VIALHFGDAAAPLFGVYHPATRAAGAPRAIVICNAFGAEYMVSHHALRRIAITLAANGYDVLRFDYYGTGDSAGEPEEVSLARWTDDIVLASDELLGVSGAERVSLLGVRLGVALACRAAARAPAVVDRIIAWDPVLRGDGYLAWLRWAEHARQPQRGGETHVLGHALPAVMAKELMAMDETAFATRLGPRLKRTAASAEDAPRADADGPFERALATGNLMVDPALLRDVLDACGVSSP